MMATDYSPYWARADPPPEQQQPAVFGQPTGLIEMPITWSLDDYPAFEFGAAPSLQNYRDVLGNWTADLDYMIEHTPPDSDGKTAHPPFVWSCGGAWTWHGGTLCSEIGGILQGTRRMESQQRRCGQARC